MHLKAKPLSYIESVLSQTKIDFDIKICTLLDFLSGQIDNPLGR